MRALEVVLYEYHCFNAQSQDVDSQQPLICYILNFAHKLRGAEDNESRCCKDLAYGLGYYLQHGPTQLVGEAKREDS